MKEGRGRGALSSLTRGVKSPAIAVIVRCSMHAWRLPPDFWSKGCGHSCTSASWHAGLLGQQAGCRDRRSSQLKSRDQSAKPATARATSHVSAVTATAPSYRCESWAVVAMLLTILGKYSCIKAWTRHWRQLLASPALGYAEVQHGDGQCHAWCVREFLPHSKLTTVKQRI